MTLSGYLSLIRPVNSLMIGLAVLVGEAVATSTVRLDATTVMGFLTGVFITGFSMIINDVLDFEVDKANAARRPLVMGTVRLGGAEAMAGGTLILGLSASLYTGLTTFTVAAVFAGVATLYNWKLKERGFSGNVAVALSMMIPFIYGGVLVEGWTWNPLLYAMGLTAFFAGVGREVIKGIVDVEGDSLRNVRSLARVRGSRRAAHVGAIFFLLAVSTSLVPPLMAKTSWAYYIVIGATDVLFIYLGVFVVKWHGREDARRVKKLALVGMFTGMVGFILEGLLRGLM